MRKISSIEKETKLKEKIEKAKTQLKKLKQKRKIEIGALAIKYGLDKLTDSQLAKAFARLKKEHDL